MKHFIPKYTLMAYWLLFTYIVAALVWWFIDLEQQSFTIFQLEKQLATDSEGINTALIRNKNRNIKYIGEGVVCLSFLLMGAVIFYRLIRSMFYITHKERNFLLAVTHEFKTPITTIQLNLETLKKKQLPFDTTQKLIQKSIDESKRLNHVYNNLLLAAQFTETKKLSYTFEAIEIGPFVEKILKSYQISHPDRPFKSINQSPPDTRIHANPQLIELCILNLLDNARKYSPAPGPVHIIIRCLNKKKIAIAVKDEGIGISKNNKKYIFDRFYRVQNEHTRESKGSGLGLYIVREIIRLHKGAIHVSDNAPKGSIFHIILNK